MKSKGNLLTRTELNAVLAAGILSMALLVAAGARAAGPLTMKIEPRTPRIGEPILLEVKTGPGVHTAGVSFLGHSFHLEKGSVPGKFWGILPISLKTRPGNKKLSIAIWGHDGSSRWVKVMVRVESRHFQEESLDVKARFSRPGTLERRKIAMDRIRLRRALMRHSVASLLDGPFVLPVHSRITDEFGTKRIFNKRHVSRHKGTDLDGQVGDSVRASNRGRVVLASKLFYSGNTVIIDHGAGMTTMYYHLSRVLVRRGDMVGAGQKIGEIGATGRVTGPHLHFGAKIRGSYINPIALCKLPLEQGPSRIKNMNQDVLVLNQ
ncbi:MAG: M23 family metallopeptidase [Deltaproteobacteria bacterium]|nr:M23 family metallopeptidase [Deltaproteobacteria bacterium]